MKSSKSKYIERALRIGILSVLLVGLLAGTPARAGALSGDSSAFGNSLAGWMNVYWQWYFGAASVPQDGNGNAVVGNVVLMALPAATGDGTPASLDVTLKSGQAFVLPLLGAHGTSYSDGTPPDDYLPRSIFETLELQFWIDGELVIDGASAMDFYSESFLDPPIPFDYPPLAALIYQQSIALAHTPLPPGAHVMKLHVKNTEPIFGYFAEFNNTWNITVLPGK